MVKASILQVYELVLEAYRQHFRHHKKAAYLMSVNFAHKKKKICLIIKITSLCSLKSLRTDLLWLPTLMKRKRSSRLVSFKTVPHPVMGVSLQLAMTSWQVLSLPGDKYHSCPHIALHCMPFHLCQENQNTNTSVLIQGFEVGFTDVPLTLIIFSSGLVVMYGIKLVLMC